MNKVVVYTCITGGYDSLKQPKVVSANVDYICFTDRFSGMLGAWKFIPIPDELKWLSNVKKQRVVKICPHRYLNQYDISVWVDGNIEITGDINKFIDQYDLEKIPFYTRVHPVRDCIYDEAQTCKSLGKDSVKKIDEQVKRYESEGYPKHIGMVETCIILRKHNDPKCIEICNAWATELLLNSHRDQLSFNYVCWKRHFLPGILAHEFKSKNNKFFKSVAHG